MNTVDLPTRIRPYRIASDTYVIPQVIPAPPIGLVYINSVVITGTEPILVDTGSPSNRQAWLEDAWSLVDPADVRWVFLTHEDHDHAGNLRQVMNACPNATLVTTWLSMARYAVDCEDMWMPFGRMRWIRDGEQFDAGDRLLAAVRPPLYDNPTTRGLLDTRTGVYCSADAFAASVPHPAEDAADVNRDDWREGVLLMNRLNSPWHLWLDRARFDGYVDAVQALGIEVLATAHGPAVHGAMVDEAFGLIRRLPDLPNWTEPGQDDLDAMLAATGAPGPGPG
jgi:flavorubredoxin